MNVEIIKPVSYYTQKENQYFDRKSARIKPLEALRHIVGFANAEGGQLVIGIENDGEITGFNYEEANKIEDYKNISLTELRETPVLTRCDVLKVKNSRGEDDCILVISVPLSPDRVIKSYDGKVYLRQSDKTKELKFDQILELEYDRGQRFFEDEIAENATLEDLDSELLCEYKSIMNVPNLTAEEVLEARNLLIQGKLTNAGLLLFAKNPSKYLPQARLRVVKYDGTHARVGQDINIIKERTIEGPIPKIIKECREYVNSQLREFQYLDADGRFKKMPEYPEFAWFEGIVNAVTHRNYSIRGDHIKILMFDDRLEIHSPGLLPNIVTIENIMNQRYSRNPRIARVLTEFGWVKEMNEGVKRIYSEMEKLFLEEPKYSEPGNSVLLVLENNVLNRRLRLEDNLKVILAEQTFIELSPNEKMIIHYMYNTGDKMTTQKAAELLGKGSTYSRKLLKTLENKGLLNWHGTSITDSTQYYTFDIM